MTALVDAVPHVPQIYNVEGSVEKVTPRFGWLYCREIQASVFFHNSHARDNIDVLEHVQRRRPDLTRMYRVGDSVLFNAIRSPEKNGTRWNALPESVRLMKANMHRPRYEGTGEVIELKRKLGFLVARFGEQNEVVKFNRNALYPFTAPSIGDVLCIGAVVAFVAEDEMGVEVEHDDVKYRAISVHELRLGALGDDSGSAAFVRKRAELPSQRELSETPLAYSYSGYVDGLSPPRLSTAHSRLGPRVMPHSIGCRLGSSLDSQFSTVSAIDYSSAKEQFSMEAESYFGHSSDDEKTVSFFSRYRSRSPRRRRT